MQALVSLHVPPRQKWMLNQNLVQVLMPEVGSVLDYQIARISLLRSTAIWAKAEMQQGRQLRPGW